MVLILPKEFIKMHENDSLEQLLEIKKHMNNFILEYESGIYDEIDNLRRPTYSDQYNNDKAILIELNELIAIKKADIITIKPTVEEVEKYLDQWRQLDNYVNQENSLDKLFFDLIPNNQVIEDILIKCSTLNDFYSTNIFSIFPVAKHILELDIDKRLQEGDLTLVNDIADVEGLDRRFYSFASKYCSHHCPDQFPIYDSYVDKVLRYFRRKDKFANFKNDDLKDYVKFKGILEDFKVYYSLEQ